MAPSPADRLAASSWPRSKGPTVTIDTADVPRATKPFTEVAYKQAIERLISGPPPEPDAMGFDAEDGFSDDVGATLADMEDLGLSEVVSDFKPADELPVRAETLRIEACTRYTGTLVPAGRHALAHAAFLAFVDHRPFVLSPDMIWLMIAQGFANHVNANAEELRSKFVQHQGKATIEVRRDDFVKGSPENPWTEVFTEFSDAIRGHIGAETHDLLLPRFSTTGVAEQAASEVVLMDAMQSYFEYEVITLCGIPQIILEGTVDDWTLLAERTRQFGQFGLESWTASLAPILAEFVAAARGKADRAFWQSFYKYEQRSGGSDVTGWLTEFFPYLNDGKTGLATWRKPSNFTMDDSSFPVGLAQVPFTWKYYGTNFKMKFLAGFVGVEQDHSTLALRPEIGWAVAEVGDAAP